MTDEAVYGRLLDLLGNTGLRDARRGLATLRHPGGLGRRVALAAPDQSARRDLRNRAGPVSVNDIWLN